MMTKKELEKEAEEKYVERLKQSGHKVEYRNQTYNDGYIDGAEPREKRITELDINVTYYAERAEHAELQNRDIVIRNKELEKENAALKQDWEIIKSTISEVVYQRDKLVLENKLLKEENDKLRKAISDLEEKWQRFEELSKEMR